jgi:hypothetical protein
MNTGSTPLIMKLMQKPYEVDFGHDC